MSTIGTLSHYNHNGWMQPNNQDTKNAISFLNFELLFEWLTSISLDDCLFQDDLISKKDGYMSRIMKEMSLKTKNFKIASNQKFLSIYN